MIHFIFLASDSFDFESLNDIEKFVNNYSEIQGVALNDEDEFNLLLKLIGVTGISCIELTNPNFSGYWDLSHFKLPEFDDQQFDLFYENWIQKSNRDNNMDEFGSLIFLKGLSSKWNKLNYRMVLRENA